MSEMVHEKGKIRKLEKLNNETLEQQCARLLDYQELPKWVDDYRELIRDRYEEFFVHKEDVYAFEDYQNLDYDESYINFQSNNDGTFSFDARYYNGGCCLSELLEDELNSLKSQK